MITTMTSTELKSPCDIKIYQVGGSVRDMFLDPDARPDDIDYVVCAENYDVMRQALVDSGHRIFLEKPEHATIRAKKGKDAVDYTLCQGGSLETDLAQRDFTVNAMALDDDGTLHDPHGGRADLESQTLRCVGDARERLCADPVRVLRALRFVITKGFALHPDLEAALTDAEVLQLLTSVSKDRKRAELQKMFTHDTVASMTLLTHYPSILPAVFTDGVWLKPTSEKRKGH